MASRLEPTDSSRMLRAAQVGRAPPHRQQQQSVAQQLRHQRHSQKAAPRQAVKPPVGSAAEAVQSQPNSNLGKAIEYLRRHWEGLTLFLRQASAPLDSNAENLKKVVLFRKNSLFYKTAEGARTGDIYLSIITTCQLNEVNPHEYLTGRVDALDLQSHFGAPGRRGRLVLQFSNKTAPSSSRLNIPSDPRPRFSASP